MYDPAQPAPWNRIRSVDQAALYEELAGALDALLAGEPDSVANAANAAAAIYNALPGLNWAGFYFLRDNELVLGPFQGRPACVRIALGNGVCGTAAAQRRSVLVPDVEAFPGHIACDAASRSELVVCRCSSAMRCLACLTSTVPFSRGSTRLIVSDASCWRG